MTCNLIWTKSKEILSVYCLVWHFVVFLGIILTLPLALIVHNQLFPISYEGWYSILILGINAVTVQFLEIYSLQRLSASFVVLVFLLDPILTGIFARWIFGETLAWLNLLAFAVILVGLYLAVSSPSVDFDIDSP